MALSVGDWSRNLSAAACSDLVISAFISKIDRGRQGQSNCPFPAGLAWLRYTRVTWITIRTRDGFMLQVCIPERLAMQMDDFTSKWSKHKADTKPQWFIVETRIFHACSQHIHIHGYEYDSQGNINVYLLIWVYDEIKIKLVRCELKNFIIRLFIINFTIALPWLSSSKWRSRLHFLAAVWWHNFLPDILLPAIRTMFRNYHLFYNLHCVTIVRYIL